MTTRGKDQRTGAPPKDGEESAPNDLLTSDDLFGDIVDAAVAADRPGARPGARKGPIKVQVSEPGAARKNSPLSSPSSTGEKLPEDVAALLDAFSEPAESALRQEDAELETVPPERASVDELVEEPPPTVTPAD